MRTGMKWVLFSIIIGGFMLAIGPVRADQVVYFSNGKAIVVKSAEKQDKFTILEMDGGGKIGVPTEQIARIEEYQASVPPPQGIAAAPPPVPVTSPIAAAQAAAPAAPGAVPPGAPQAAAIPAQGSLPPQVMVPGAGGPRAVAATGPLGPQRDGMPGQIQGGRLNTQPRAGAQSGAYGGGRYSNTRGGPMLSAGAGVGGRGSMGGRTGVRPRADRLGPRGAQVGAPPSGTGGAGLSDGDRKDPVVERSALPQDPAPEETAPASDEPSTEPEEEVNPDTPPAEPQED